MKTYYRYIITITAIILLFTSCGISKSAKNVLIPLPNYSPISKYYPSTIEIGDIKMDVYMKGPLYWGDEHREVTTEVNAHNGRNYLLWDNSLCTTYTAKERWKINTKLMPEIKRILNNMGYEVYDYDIEFINLYGGKKLIAGIRIGIRNIEYVRYKEQQRREQEINKRKAEEDAEKSLDLMIKKLSEL